MATGTLTSVQIGKLHDRHGVLTAQMREIVQRLEIINDTIRTKKTPQGIAFDDIGTPLKERPV